MAPRSRCSRLALLLAASPLQWRPFRGDAFVALSPVSGFPHHRRHVRSKAGSGAGVGRCTRARKRGRGEWRTQTAVGMNAADTASEAVSGATATAAAQAEVKPFSPSGSASGDEGSSGPETESGKRRRRRRGRRGRVAEGGKSHVEMRSLGSVEGEGFTGTRLGYQVLKAYEVPEQAPINLPEGEDEGYPMLMYQFMHAQYREDFPSQSSARKAVRRKELLLNGAEVRNDSKVKPGDTVTLQKRVQPGLFPQGKPTCELPVVWEDDYLAVIIKPHGVAVHGGTGEDDPGAGGRRSVRQALPYMLQPTKSEDRPLHRPLHCHRLDKHTGGLMVCAKTRPALSAVSDAFEKRLVSKRYVALVAGELEGSGAISMPLDGKECHTIYRVRGSPVRSLKTDVITTVDLWPITGRRHQLRRHLSSIGYPIIGDRRYTPDEVPFQEGGMYLNAVGLTFSHPITGEELNFSIPEPAKYEKWRQKEHQRWLQHHQEELPHAGGGEEESVKRSVNVVPEIEGLQFEERDGFRYYQYDWSVVGGKPTALSTGDIDTALGDALGDT